MAENKKKKELYGFNEYGQFGEEKRKKLVLLNILEILQKYTDEKHTLTVSEIGGILEDDYGITVDRKAIKKNLGDLMAQGYEIKYTVNEKTVNGKKTKILTDWYILREFSDAELRLILDSLTCSKHISHKQFKSLVKKIEALGNVYFSKRMKHLTTIHEKMPENTELFLNIEILDEAISNGKQVSFTYNDYGTDKKLHPRTDAEGKARVYIVNPYQTVTANGRYYLIGSSTKYNSVVHYRIDKMKRVKPLNTPAKPPELVKGLENGLELPTHVAEHIYMFSGECGMVTFRAKKNIVHDVIDWFGTDVRFFDEKEDDVGVAVRVNYNAMKYWALQYCQHVTVVSPPALAEDIGATLTAASDKYKHI